MRTWIVILLLVAALYYEHRRKLAQAPRGVGHGRRPMTPRGVTRSTGSGVRQATQFSTTGSSSPGSGLQTRQPSMGSTWGIGGVYGPGNVGPTYLPQHASRAA